MSPPRFLSFIYEYIQTGYTHLSLLSSFPPLPAKLLSFGPFLMFMSFCFVLLPTDFNQDPLYDHTVGTWWSLLGSSKVTTLKPMTIFPPEFASSQQFSRRNGTLRVPSCAIMADPVFAGPVEATNLSCCGIMRAMAVMPRR